MAMVEAYKGERKIKVSRSAYENIFKKQGYKETGKKPVPVEEPILGEEQEKGIENGASETTPDYETIPISDMNKEQLMQYAKKHNIDTKGAKSVSEARKIIEAEVKKRNEA